MICLLLSNVVINVYAFSIRGPILLLFPHLFQRLSSPMTVQSKIKHRWEDNLKPFARVVTTGVWT